MGSPILIRIYIFISGISVIAIGIIGTSQLGKEVAAPFLLGALTLGGGLVICGLFSFRMLWHGVIAAGVLALLGFGRGLLNLPKMADSILDEKGNSSSSLLELLVALICIFLLLRVIASLSRERSRRMLAESE